MKTAVAASLLALSLSIPAAAGTVNGAWTSRVDEKHGTVQLNLTTRGTTNFGEQYTLSDLAGLTAAAAKAQQATAVQFRLRREPGTLSFEGSFRDGIGAGHFTFEPNPAWPSLLQKMGLPVEPRGEHTVHDELLLHALVGLTADYVASMQHLYPGATLREIRNARAVGVDPAAQRDLQSVMHVDGLRDATRLTAVGVTADYVRDLRGAGVDISGAREATRLRAAGVTPEFVARLAAAGYRGLSAHDLSRLAASGVDGAFAESMKKHQKNGSPSRTNDRPGRSPSMEVTP